MGPSVFPEDFDFLVLAPSGLAVSNFSVSLVFKSGTQTNGNSIPLILEPNIV